MHRTALQVAAWLAAGVAAVSLASAGVSMVGNQVTGSRPSPLSAAEVEAELDARGTARPEPTPSTIAPTTSAPPEEEPREVPTTSTTPGAAPPSVVAPPPTAPQPAPAVTRTYTLVGGTATLRFTSTGVTVVVANPNAGFSVDTEPAEGNGVRVEFRSADHRSRVEGWWDGGPRDDVDEDDDVDEGAEADEAD